MVLNNFVIHKAVEEYTAAGVAGLIASLNEAGFVIVRADEIERLTADVADLRAALDREEAERDASRAALDDAVKAQGISEIQRDFPAAAEHYYDAGWNDAIEVAALHLEGVHLPGIASQIRALAKTG